MRGGLVLGFDDGYANWVDIIAPELEKVGGTATGYVNNRNIPERLSVEDLKTLRDEYGWEIGTHTYQHLNAENYARQHGPDQWTEKELVQSIRELEEAGFEIRSLAFPFNISTPETRQAAMEYVQSYRVVRRLAIADGPSPDGSIPATSIDIAGHVPPDLLTKWVDLAYRMDRLLFLYGHRILPDDMFTTGTVTAVENDMIIAAEPVQVPPETAFSFVPDISKRVLGDTKKLTVRLMEGNKVFVDGGDLTTMTEPGATFMIGPRYGTRLSDFRRLIQYAAGKMPFYTVRDVVAKEP